MSSDLKYSPCTNVANSYVLFSIGNVRPLLQDTFPSCWKTFETCNETWTQAVDYLEIIGIMVGKLLVCSSR
jgi:hypothetical protein